MRYKIAGIVVCIFAILISVILPAFYDPAEQRYHQHLMASKRRNAAMMPIPSAPICRWCRSIPAG